MKWGWTIIAMLLGCSHPTAPTSPPPPPGPTLRLGKEEPEPPPSDEPPALDPKLIAPPEYRPPADEKQRRPAKRIRLPGTSGKQRITVSAKVLGKPTEEGLQWIRVHVDAHGSSAGLLTQLTIAVDARDALAQAAARKLVKGLERMARVKMIPLTTEPGRHGEMTMTSGNRAGMLESIEAYGKKEEPAALAPALGGVSGNLVIIAAAEQWADDEAGLQRVTERLETLGLHVQLLLVGRNVDAEPFAAVEQVHRVSSRGQIDAAVDRIIRHIPRAHFLAAGISLTFPEGMRALGGRRGIATEDNRTTGFHLGDLWTGFRHETDVLVEVDPKLGRTQTVSAKIRYSYRNPKPGTSILSGNKTSRLIVRGRVRLP